MVGRRAVCRERGTWLHELSNAGVAEVGGTGAATPAPATWHWGAWLGCTGQCGTFLVASRCWPLPTARVCEKTKVPTSSRHPGQIPTRIATLLHTFRTCTSPAADCNPISPWSYDTRGRHTVLCGSCVPNHVQVVRRIKWQCSQIALFFWGICVVAALVCCNALTASGFWLWLWLPPRPQVYWTRCSLDLVVRYGKRHAQESSERGYRQLYILNRS